MIKRISLFLAILAAGACSSHAQLAITEAMSSASTNGVIQNSDFWELSNFGTNTIDLTGYSWDDNSGGLAQADPAPFVGLTIGPGESIIFFQSTAPASTNADQFRAWWGLSPSVQAVMFVGNGLGSTGDGIRLYGPGAVNDADVVDSVDFLDALRGSTFTYDPATGAFGIYSTNGVGGAFKAATSDDIGSPGTNSGPVAVTITTQPADTSVNVGDNATFTVGATGLPRPTYQWFFGSTAIAGATRKTLVITNAQVANVGPYHVEVNNAGPTVTSSNAVLSLNALPAPPTITQPAKNQNLFIGQSGTFRISATGVPQPTYQWYFSTDQTLGALILGASTNFYTVANAQIGDSGTYRVIVQNSQGRATNEATLNVTTRPNLVITEVMSAESTNPPTAVHNDWFELSNLDNHSVDLTGYRLDDNSAMLSAAFTITNPVVIAPGESIIFVENSTPDQFRAWWGAGNLPMSLQIVTYRGGGLGLSGPLGDEVVLWNSGATDDSDVMTLVTFSVATTGVSFGYDAGTDTFGDLSVEGLNGAFRSQQSGDIGSPGYIRNPSNPRILQFTKEGSDFKFRWTTEAGQQYKLQYKRTLSDLTWSDVVTLPASGSFLEATDTAPADNQRFYQAVRVGP